MDYTAIKADLLNFLSFSRAFTKLRKVGSGADGIVTAHTHNRTGQVIAVKVPHPDRHGSSGAITAEAKVLSKLGRHENIMDMITYTCAVTSGPAIFSEFAPLGNLWEYREKWIARQKLLERPYGIQEITVWKLFRDMALALEYLHEKCGYIHRDVKPDNIIVTFSEEHNRNMIPTVPVFKLCDFSRAVVSPSPGGKFHGWAGTLEYAPPPDERHESVAARPAGDIWSLGATIQAFALDIFPLQSRRHLVAQMKKRGEPHPKLHGDEGMWASRVWRFKFSAVYRPLNVRGDALVAWWDVPKTASSFRPFSDELNRWYAMLWAPKPRLRVSSAKLVRDLVPLVDGFHFSDQELDEFRRVVTPLRKVARQPLW